MREVSLISLGARLDAASDEPIRSEDAHHPASRRASKLVRYPQGDLSPSQMARREAVHEVFDNQFGSRRGYAWGLEPAKWLD